MYAPGRDYYFPEYASSPSEGVSVDSDEAYARTVAARAWFGDLTLQGLYIGREKEMPTGAFGVNLGDHRASTNDYRGFVEARLQTHRSQTNIDARLSIDTYRNRWFGPYGRGYVLQDQGDETWATGLLQVNQTLGSAFAFTAGVDTRQNLGSRLATLEQEAIGSDPYNTIADVDTRLRQYSGYLVLDAHPGDVLRINLGGRYDFYDSVVNNQSDFSTANPRGSIILSPGNEVIKLVGGTAFRAPSPFELFYDDGGASIVPPESLDPETITTADFEWTHTYSQTVTSTFNAYYNEIRGLIVDEPLGGPRFQKANVGDVIRTTGAEAEFRRWWRSGWMFAGQVSWQRTRTGTLESGTPLDNSPPWLASIMGGGSFESQCIACIEDPRRGAAVDQVRRADRGCSDLGPHLHRFSEQPFR